MKREVTIGLSLIAAATAVAQEGELSYKATEIEPGLYMIEGVGGFTGGNLGLLVGNDGVVLIDDSLPNISQMTVEEVEDIAGAPVDFVINTHAHGDHVGGNAALNARGATIVAHENLRRAMAADSANPPESLPELTFTDEVTFHLNGHTANVMHVASAHTDGDGIIHFPEVNVIHTGDVMFNYLFPFIDLDGGGSVDGYIAAQQKMLAMADDQTRIIPGHGPLASKADLEAAVRMLIDAQSRVKALVDAGRSKDEILAENPLADYHDTWNWGFITTERMTETLIRSLTGE